MDQKDRETNILGQPLATCSLSPLTGFSRDGACRMPTGDFGRHGVCAEVTEDFLNFTRGRGNDLSTPQPLYGFPGLKPGDRWCLCADRWAEAAENGVAPPVVLSATHADVLARIPMERLVAHALTDEREN
ncbi:MAG: DUF2237 domain-containing protein [Desulfobacterales bacterium]|nr:DUF2237 domain-containing protein [Desulfobacterales bacterium]